MMHWKQFSFQSSSSPYMDMLDIFNDYCMMMCSSIMILITYMMFSNKISQSIDYLTLGFNTLELLWALVPILILIIIAIPSLWILYLLDEDSSPIMTIKIIGSQWFWTYEYPDFNNITFDSYMKSWENKWDFRLLDVDNRLILPTQAKIRLLITANDVIHAWTIPSLGVKVDAVPGRLNQTFLFMDKLGLYFGQCSEICGINHSFMPICVEGQSSTSFLNWIFNY
uniref:Cytochrome c oxidase subunit 2 n=1 Tax=Paratemnoides elongatus TaxID=51805 RepID=H9MFH1_9ARAC|nr:cytochrome c oxidase subunit II [Paratemnoides elongatus]AEX37716.1 cytochrome c oxidase subunit 2 [Paratemnoides elongatus]